MLEVSRAKALRANHDIGLNSSSPDRSFFLIWRESFTSSDLKFSTFALAVNGL